MSTIEDELKRRTQEQSPASRDRTARGDEPPELDEEDERILDEVWAAIDLGVDDELTKE